MRVYEAIVTGLESVDVTTVFGGPGETVPALQPVPDELELFSGLAVPIPHRSPSPDGVIAGTVDTIEERFRR